MDKLKLNSTQIKIIAIALMLADHIHQMFLPFGAPAWLNWLGRPVFPMFLFCAAEAFYYTHDRKKYLFRFLIASWAMTLLTTVTQFALPNPGVVLVNNAFSTFLIAALYMLFWDILADGIKTKNTRKIIGGASLFLVPILTAAPLFAAVSLAGNTNVPEAVVKILTVAGMFLPNLLMTEGGFVMVAIGVLFYIFRGKRFVQVGILAAFSVIQFFAGGDDMSKQWLMGLAVIPMLLYNGGKGKGMKWFFYVFYPAHIIILYVISTLIKV